MKKRSLSLVSIVIGLSLMLGACSAKSTAEQAPAFDTDSKSSEFEDVFTEEYAEMEEAPSSGRGENTGINASADLVNRMVIYNADLQIAVADPEASLKSVIQMAEEAGGYVVNSNIYQRYTESGSMPRASLTVRVPAGRLNSIMAAIKALTPNPGEDVISENISGQDVTAEFTDLTSRLRNLEAAEEALVALMEEAKDPQDVLDIFGELTYYRGEIEVVKGRMKYLEESAALSSLTVEIVAKASLQPITVAGWEPKGTVKSAVEALINTGQLLADAAIWFGIYCLPFLVPLSIGVYILVRLLRKRKLTKKVQKTEVIEKAEVSKD